MNNCCCKTILGSRNVLLSAPHVFPHKRPRLNRTFKLGEPFTDNIVEDVCFGTNSFGITLVGESDFDPNYHKERKNEYKKKIREIVEKNKVKYFLDIHGLSDNHLYDIGIYYPSKFLKSIRLANVLEGGLSKGMLRGINISVLRFLDNEQETLGEFVASKLRIPSVQIEVARYLREDKVLRDSLIENLSKIISEVLV